MMRNNDPKCKGCEMNDEVGENDISMNASVRTPQINW